MALLLLLAATPALGQIRGDQALSPVVLGAAPARQESARVASDGTNFFTVWITRTGSNAIIGGGRMSPAGELLDRPSILIASGTGLGAPDVVFVGGNFLVVYQSGTSVMARRVSREGRLVDQQAVVIINTSMRGQLATNGDNVVLLTATNTIRMLAADGTPLGADRVVPNAGIYAPSVTSNGSQYLIAYPSDYASRGSFTILNSKGDVEHSNAFTIPEPFYISGLTLASNGSSFLMMLVSSSRIAFMPIDSAGNAGPLRKTGYQIGGAIVATWSGNEYTLAWPTSKQDYSSQSQILAARFDATGLPLDAAPVAITPLLSGGSSYPFATANNGRDTIIITRESDYVGWRTTAAIFKSLPQIDAEPAARRRVAIASSAPEQAGGSIASNGTMSLVAWRERAGFQTVARAAFIAADGQLGTPIDLGDADPQSVTATASNGRDFLVAYFDSHWALVARRVTLEGLDTNPTVITPYGNPPDSIAIGWSGQAWVVMTARYIVTISGITADGAVTVPRQVITPSEPADTPVVQCGGSGCSAMWHLSTPTCFYLCSYTENNVFARTNANGNLVSQVLLTDVLGVTPALAAPLDDGKSLFVYSRGTTMFAGRITEVGVVLDAPAINGGVGILYSGTKFPLQPVAAVRNGLYLVELDDYTAGRLYWIRYVTEPRPRTTSLVNLHQSVTIPLTMTASSRNAYLLYTSGEDDPTLMAPRIFLRTLASPDPQPSPVRRHAAR
ncbi:MAG: hypothetical protein QOK37_2384 [Thermoanaerobaculia bacterium]|nr:hypothetical protein [Thermoanaerobaculia bacterium]